MQIPAFLFFVFGIFLTFGNGQVYGKVRSQHSSVEVQFDRMIAAPGDTVTLAWVIRPESGWHIYWKNPGNSGAAPEIRWVGLPKGTQVGELEFPVPERIPYRGLVNYGYSEETWLFQKIVLPKTATTGTLSFYGDAKWLICKDECLPAKASLRAEISMGTQNASVQRVGTDPASASARATDLKRHWMKAADRFPRPNAEAFGLLADVAKVSTPDPYIVVSIRDVLSERKMAAELSEPYFFPLNATVDSRVIQKTRVDADGTLQLWIPVSASSGSFPLTGVFSFGMSGEASSEGRSGFLLRTAVTDTITLKPEDFAKLVLKESSPVGHSNAAAQGIAQLAAMLFFAFLGGMILNLMPCVLPVLSIKLLSMVEHSQASVAETRRNAWAYFLGILSTFWMIAALGIALKSAGQAVGWGFQLQSPIFVGVLAVLFFGMAMNLLGVFEFAFAGLGRLSSMQGGGAFFSGFLTVVAATPCSAPFMTTALGYALTQPAWILFLILSFLGLGLALPFLLVVWIPALRKRVPRPGKWMLTFKKVLAIPLFATTAWLGWVLSSQAGISGVSLLIAALLAITGLSISWGKVQRREGSKPIQNWVWAWVGLVASAGVFALDLSPKAAPPTASVTPVSKGLTWKKFSEKEVELARSQGRPVFVDFTADWCVTCHVNESLVLETDPVQQAFTAAGVELFRADWTNADPEITSSLEKVGRNSVPVYLWYAPETLKPEILPQILSQGMILTRVKPFATR